MRLVGLGAFCDGPVGLLLLLFLPDVALVCCCVVLVVGDGAELASAPGEGVAVVLAAGVGVCGGGTAAEVASCGEVGERVEVGGDGGGGWFVVMACHLDLRVLCQD